MGAPPGFALPPPSSSNRLGREGRASPATISQIFTRHLRNATRSCGWRGEIQGENDALVLGAGDKTLAVIWRLAARGGQQRGARAGKSRGIPRVGQFARGAGSTFEQAAMPARSLPGYRQKFCHGRFATNLMMETPNPQGPAAERARSRRQSRRRIAILRALPRYERCPCLPQGVQRR